MSSEEIRTVQVYKENTWQETELKEIRDGDLFRIFEPDGTPVKSKYGEGEFVADGDAFFDESLGVWSVETRKENTGHSRH